MNCEQCGSNKTYVKKHHHEYEIKGKKITFDSDRRFCQNCDNLVYDEFLDNQASKIAISLYNKESGLAKEDIKKLRTMYSLSLDDFSKIIGCSKKTLISYEKGTSIPNDIYLVTLKLLIENPEIIYYFIEDNLERFQSKEYDRIVQKVYPVIGPNIKNLKNQEYIEASEYNGFTELNYHKIKNLILILSTFPISKTKLNKEMFYVDFLCYKKYAHSVTGLLYKKLQYGPVPDDYEKFLEGLTSNSDIKYQIQINKDLEKHEIIALKEADTSIFLKEEIDIIQQVKNKFKNYSSQKIVNYSHQEKAFQNTKLLEPISYKYALDLNFDKKE